METKFVTIINDCKSQNDIGRLKTRYSLLFPGVNINFVGVDSNLGTSATLEAGGNLVDILDAGGGEPGVVAVNVAPRGQIKEDGENGSKFCYFWYRKTLVVSTIKAYSLFLVKKLGLINKISVLETEKVLRSLSNKKVITGKLAHYINNSQFRSFDFQPRVAKWLTEGISLDTTTMSAAEIPTLPNSVWLVDSFGNAKTTIILDDLIQIIGRPWAGKRVGRPFYITTSLGTLGFYERLKDIPDSETAMYLGSSGIGDERFVEIATQNRAGSAAKNLGLKVGDRIEIY